MSRNLFIIYNLHLLSLSTSLSLSFILITMNKLVDAS